MIIVLTVLVFFFYNYDTMFFSEYVSLHKHEHFCFFESLMHFSEYF